MIDKITKFQKNTIKVNFHGLHFLIIKYQDDEGPIKYLNDQKLK